MMLICDIINNYDLNHNYLLYHKLTSYLASILSGCNEKLNLFIDVTKITNKLGSESITINCENKKKNITPLTMICDQNKLPLCVSNVEINKTIYNNRKTAKHEIKNVPSQSRSDSRLHI